MVMVEPMMVMPVAPTVITLSHALTKSFVVLTAFTALGPLPPRFPIPLATRFAALIPVTILTAFACRRALVLAGLVRVCVGSVRGRRVGAWRRGILIGVLSEGRGANKKPGNRGTEQEFLHLGVSSGGCVAPPRARICPLPFQAIF
jgi:hypothetical protein